MGHGALFVKYDKPNYKLHFAILVAIIATSVVLSLQVSKKKQATDIVAMKQPVPIDSIASRPELPASDNEAQINEATLIPKVSDSTSSFIAQIENGQSTALPVSTDVNSEMVADNTTMVVQKVAVAVAEVQAENDVVSDPDSQSLDSMGEMASETTLTEIEPAKVIGKTETLAVTEEKTEQVVETNKTGTTTQQTIVADAVVETNDTVENNTLQVSVTSADKEKINKLKSSNTISLDDVYHKQQENFLSTLAKSVEKDNVADNSVKKIREAIRNDKPIETATDAVDVAPVKAKQKVASLDKNKLGVNKKDDKKKVLSRITRGELNNVLSQFTYYYNSGDIKRLMNLFNDQATTNGQSSKQGIKNDYADLFSTTQARRLMLKNIKWNLDSAKASGAADFEVVIQTKNGAQRSSLKGVLNITAIKGADGIYITRLFHEVH